MWKAGVTPSFHCFYTLLIIILNNRIMERKELKRTGFKVFVYWYDQERPDVLVLHRFTEKALYSWLDNLMSDISSSITHVEVHRFYY